MKFAYVCLMASVVLTSCQSVFPNASPVAAVGNKSCSSPASSGEVSDTVRSFFAALAADDDAAVRRLTTPSFYVFDVGKRYTGPELSKLIADAHKSGRILQWNIGAMDTRVDCAIAFAAWENRGAAGTTAKLEPRSWLESALLLRQGNRWVIDFLHSTPKDPRSR